MTETVKGSLEAKWTAQSDPPLSMERRRVGKFADIEPVALPTDDDTETDNAPTNETDKLAQMLSDTVTIRVGIVARDAGVLLRDGASTTRDAATITREPGTDAPKQ